MSFVAWFHNSKHFDRHYTHTLAAKSTGLTGFNVNAESKIPRAVGTHSKNQAGPNGQAQSVPH